MTYLSACQCGPSHGLRRNSRKTEPGAKQFPVRMAVRAAPFALLKTAAKTERGVKHFPIPAVRATFCAFDEQAPVARRF